MSTNGEPLKIVTVGDATVGKTALLVRYSEGKFAVDDYKPTLLEQSLVTVKYREENYQVELIDTGGQEDFEQIRKKYYSEADIFLLCFDISSPTTFSNVKAKWMKEIPTSKPDGTPIPIVLVGNKIDLRNELDKFISRDEGQSLAKTINARDYKECSAKGGQGISEVFSAAIKTYLHEEAGCCKPS